MAITRIFRARIRPEQRGEFEEKFFDVSSRVIPQAAGNLLVSVLKPTKWSPNEYAMISVWEDVESLRAFAGNDWNRAVIPPGTEKFFTESWMHHFESWE